MTNKYTPEIIFLLLVIALSVTGFSSLFTGQHAERTAYQYLHIVTSFAWLLLLLVQLLLIRQGSGPRHRAVGQCIFFAGPVLVASLTLLTVHSAVKDAEVGKADFMVVQNVMVTLELALLIFLAFVLRKNRRVHGALLLSTTLLFMGIALFFTLISYVPGYVVSGPGTFSRFAEAAQMVAYVGGVIALLFFLKNRSTGWPWLLTGSFFFLNGFLQMIAARMNGTKPLTSLVASIGRVPAFVLGLLVFGALIWLAWRVGQARRASNQVVAE